MLRITRELERRGFETDHQLKDLLQQINLMKAYGTLQGKRMPPDIAKKIAELAYLSRYCREDGRASAEFKPDDYTAMSRALELAFDVHGTLAELIKPVTPESIEASAPRQGLFARIFWPRVTDILIAVTAVAIALCAASALLTKRFPEARLEQVFYLGAALLGATFSQLYTAYKFVCARTFDPYSGSSYMVRVVLGAVSGLILANLGNQILLDSATGSWKALAPGALALIGGYSADAVNLILQRIADTLVSTVRGSGDDALKAKQVQLEAESKTTEVKHRQETVGALSQLLKDPIDQTSKDRIQQIMNAILQGEDLLKIQPTAPTNGDKGNKEPKDEPTPGLDLTVGQPPIVTG